MGQEEAYDLMQDLEEAEALASLPERKQDAAWKLGEIGNRAREIRRGATFYTSGTGGRPIPHNIYSAVKDHLIGTKEYDSVDNAIDTAEGDPLRQLQAKRAAMRMQAFKEEAAYSLGHDLDDIQQTLGE